MSHIMLLVSILAFSSMAPSLQHAAQAAKASRLQHPPDSTYAPLEALRQMWHDGMFDVVLPELVRYRKFAPYGKNEIVDYMIGTSACRIPGKRAMGREFLAWMLQHYPLIPASREKVLDEIDSCAESTAGGAVIPVLLATPGPAQTGPGVSGKMYYDITRGDDLPMSNDPVQVVREVPPESLAARLFTPEEWLDAMTSLEKRVEPSFSLAHTESFVLASATHGSDELDRVGAHLELLLNFYVDFFDMSRPEHLITVYLVPTSWDMQQMAKSIHGLLPSPQSIGYSMRDDQSMLAVSPGRSWGTLAHELFHLMVRRDFGDIPPWLDEGIAALYEVATVSEDGVRGTPNWRGPVLERFWYQRPTIEALVRMDWRGFDNADESYESSRQMANHATARYFALFLQENGLLRNVLTSFRDRPVGAVEGDPSDGAVALLMEVLGQPLDEVDDSFATWFKQLSSGSESDNGDMVKKLIDEGAD